MSERFPRPARPPTAKTTDSGRAENGARQRGLTEVERDMALCATASRILWTYATHDQERAGAEE